MTTSSVNSTNTSASTHRETVRLLCKSIVNRLENQKAITFAPRLRQVVQDEVFSLVGPYIFTDEDLRSQALAKLGANVERLADLGMSEADQYKAAKSVVKSSFGDDELNGFYFQRPLKMVAHAIVQYLMRSSHIEDVYESDEELERRIVETVQKFNPADLH